jgi:aryl-alcohol dehydrogenase-like predicted oxidoreductase
MFWVNGTQGGESEELLGRWRRSRGIGDEIVIATTAGARPLAPADGFVRPDGSLTPMDGLSAKAIRESAERSMERLGVARLDLMYAHVEDTSVPLEETVGAFGELVAAGTAGLVGVSNHWAWRVERARSVAASLGVRGMRCCSTATRTCGRAPTYRNRGRRTGRSGWPAGRCSATCGRIRD